MSPASATLLSGLLYESDVSAVLPNVAVPTLVVHRAGDAWMAPEHGRYLAEHIPGARYVEVPGDDHVVYLGDPDPILGEIEEFLTGTRQVQHVDRILATMLFTDLVESTSRAAELGDRPWRALLDRHEGAVRRLLDRYEGRERRTTGDGFLATFQSPAQAIRCATAICGATRELGLRVRAGLHTGECEIRGDELAGIVVHIAARVQAEAEPDEVLVSSTVRDLVAGSGIRFTDRGERALKGVSEPWRLFAVDAD